MISAEWATLWASATGRALWQGGITILLLWGICRLLPRMLPQARVWLWRLAYVKLLATLCIGGAVTLAVLPHTIPVHLQQPLTAMQQLPVVSALAPDAVETPAPVAAPVVEASNAKRSPGPTPWWWYLAVAWTTAVLVGLGFVVQSLRETHCLRTASTPVTDPEITGMLAELADRLRLKRLPVLLVGEVALPQLIGAWSPAIILPPALLVHNREGLRLILAHELAHVKQHDLLWNWLPMVGRMVFFFYPLVWLAERELRLAQEISADALAIAAARTSDATYGAMLVQVATLFAAPTRYAMVTVGLSESFHTLHRRILGMKHAQRMTRSRVLLTATMVAGLAVVGLVPWRLAANAAPAKPTTPTVHRVAANIFEAAADGDLAQVKKFLDADPALLNAKSPHGSSVLLRAAETGHLDVVKLLLERGADVNERLGMGITALHYTAQYDRPEIIRTLLDAGAKVNLRQDPMGGDKQGWTPLYYATQSNHPRITRMLLEHGANPDAGPVTKDGEEVTPLIMTASKGFVENARLLLQHGAKVNADIRGRTPLYGAVGSGHTALATLLRQRGGVMLVGAEPIMLAAANGDLAAVKKLVSANPALVNKADAQGMTPLEHAVATRRVSVVRYLLEQKANPEGGKKNYSLPLGMAAQYGQVEIARMLLDHGANVNGKAQMGITPLLAVAQGVGVTEESKGIPSPNQQQMVALLLKRGADVNLGDDRGWTPLHYVATASFQVLAETLVKAGANVNARSEDGETPLHRAARQNNVPTIKLLLAKGAALNAVNSRGETPLALAKFNASINPTETAAMEYLQKVGAK